MAMDPKRAHDLEQFEAYLIDLARHLGSFRRELIAQGVPEQVADDTTRDLARLFFQEPERDMWDYIVGE